MRSKVQHFTDRAIQRYWHHQSLAAYLEPVIQAFKPAFRQGRYRAQVDSIKTTVNDCLSVTLRPTQGWPPHQAGQHLQLSVEMDGRLLTRVFTIASSPEYHRDTGLIRLIIKTDANGQFTPYLMKYLRPSGWCNISAPTGDFTLDQPSAPCVVDVDEAPILMVAGGSGITPMIAILHSHLAQISQMVTLLYYAKPDQHLVVDELERLAGQYEHFSFALLNRRDHGDICLHIPKSFEGSLWVCGPSAMMSAVNAVASERNLPLRQENFGLPVTLSEEVSSHSVTTASNNFSVDNQTSLLQQLMDQSAPVTKGCGIGICHQCQCLKKSGLVRDLRTGNLSDAGEELIQLCVSQAASDVALELP